MTRSRRTTLAQLFALSALAPLALRAPHAWADTTQYKYDALGRLTLVIFDDGSSVQYTYDAAGNRTQVVRAATTPSDTFTQTIQITGSSGVNLRTLANTAGYNGAQNANVTFQLGSGVTITGGAAGGAAIDTGDWPITLHYVALTLQVSGKAFGGGGAGGKGACPGDGEVGGAGGDAVHCRLPMSLTVNSGGELKGGGGGGGGGGGRWYALDPPFDRVGGGGGGGFPNGPGGLKGTAGMDGDDTPAANGAQGTTSGGGAGGAGEASGGGAGGSGGAAGANGSNGSVGSGAGTSKARGPGGVAGYGVRKNGHAVSVTNNGTIVGTVG